MLAMAQKAKNTNLIDTKSSPILVQHKCACGGSIKLDSDCTDCEKNKLTGIQTKLKIGAANDIYEQEADRVADQVMAMSKSGDIANSPVKIQRVTGQSSRSSESFVPANIERVLSSNGSPMQPTLQQDMQQRFGHDFSNVHIHTGTVAEQSTSDISARAYTTGNNIVFGRNSYSPGNYDGQRLIAHELTHVIQQNQLSTNFQVPVVQLQGLDGEPEIPDPRDPTISSAPKGKEWKGASSKCGPDFCRPWATQRTAEDNRKLLWPFLMVAIMFKVSSKVKPLWTDWAFGGSSVKNLDKDFGKDFENSKTTAKTTNILTGDLEVKLRASPPVIPSGGSTVLDISTLIPATVKAIDTPGNRKEMNFNEIGEIPGNIAGGIGKNQVANPVGAKPSKQEDERIVSGSVTVTDDGSGKLTAMPNLNYTVKDTIDFCPGDCGAAKEQKATIPMSRWEATGISGDVPFTVSFPAITSSFTIP